MNAVSFYISMEKIKVDASNQYYVSQKFLLSELGAPQGITITTYADNCEKILITWSKPDVTKRNGPITGYQFTNTLGVGLKLQLIIKKNFFMFSLSF